MCLIAFAYKVLPGYPLILLANRDEFYQRSTRRAQFWTEEGYPKILAGKDLEGGGTWMGITKKGKWAALTNYRDLSNRKTNPPSRGNIVLDFLKSDESASNYLNALQEKATEFNGFNLLLGTGDGVWHYNNVANAITSVPPGIHGLSNAFLDTPWPKLQIAKRKLGHAIHTSKIDSDTLFAILADDKEANEKELPQTGLPQEWEKAVSSIFIKTEQYGTRCSTLLFIKEDGQVNFKERIFSFPDKPDMQTYVFRI